MSMALPLGGMSKPWLSPGVAASPMCATTILGAEGKDHFGPLPGIAVPGLIVVPQSFHSHCVRTRIVTPEAGRDQLYEMRIVAPVERFFQLPDVLVIRST